MVPALRDPKLHPFVGTDVGEVTGRAAHSSGGDTFSSLYADEADAPLRPADPDLSVGIQYTSGTTSRPKSVVWTHANALWGGKMCAVQDSYGPKMCIWPCYPCSIPTHSPVRASLGFRSGAPHDLCQETKNGADGALAPLHRFVETLWAARPKTLERC